jgi:hypothetical protein
MQPVTLYRLGVGSFVGGLMWFVITWLIDRIYGDEIFSWIEPLVPARIRSISGLIVTIVEWGPTVALLLLGILLIWRAWIQREQSHVTALALSLKPKRKIGTPARRRRSRKA